MEKIITGHITLSGNTEPMPDLIIHITAVVVMFLYGLYHSAGKLSRTGDVILEKKRFHLFFCSENRNRAH